FLFLLGNQFVNFSQTLLLTRLIGLEAAATWAICTRAYTLIIQAISRIFETSTSALAEMMVRGESERLLQRFREITEISVNFALVTGIMLAVANGPFVQIWTSGELGWAPWNDLLLGLWLVISVTVKLHTGLVGQTKAFHFMRYIYFL